MGKIKKLSPCVVLVILLFASCDWEAGSEYHGTFDYDLRGTWVSNDTSVYNGSLVIGYNKITIMGFSEGQTRPGQSDNNRPFKGFTKGVALVGYSENGMLFIQDHRILQEGIPYTYSTTETYPREHLLRFQFGSRWEIMQKQR